MVPHTAAVGCGGGSRPSLGGPGARRHPGPSRHPPAVGGGRPAPGPFAAAHSQTAAHVSPADEANAVTARPARDASATWRPSATRSPTDHPAARSASRTAAAVAAGPVSRAGPGLPRPTPGCQGHQATIAPSAASGVPNSMR